MILTINQIKKLRKINIKSFQKKNTIIIFINYIKLYSINILFSKIDFIISII